MIFFVTQQKIGNGDIAYCDVQGELGMVTVTKVISTGNDIVQVQRSEDVVVDEESLDIQLRKEEHEVVESDDEDGENVVSLEKLKRETLGAQDNESELRSCKLN